MNMNRWHIMLTLVVAVAVLITHPSQNSPAFSVDETRFVDTQDHWAQPCIEELANRKIISGYSDNSFRPDAPITRAEFAAVVNQAFPRVELTREAENFVDIPTDYWAYNAIQRATQKGFLSGYIGGIFNPMVNIPRVQALVAITSGLGYKPEQFSVEQLGEIFTDSGSIPEYATEAIAAATENWLVVNYPNVRQLQPNRATTRADVATFICQAIANFDQDSLVPSQYIARIPISDEPLAQTPSTEPEQPVQQQPASPPQPQRQITQSPPIQPEPSPPQVQSAPRQEPVTKTVEFDDFRAEFSFRPSPTPKLSLKMTRRGEVVLDEPIPENIFNNLVSNDLDKIRFLEIRSLDLDGDKEPELIVDFKNGSYYSLIYHYRPLAKQYGVIPKNWGIWRYDLTEVTTDGLPRFVGYDNRFSKEFNVQSQTQVPIQIWEYRAGKFHNVTENYPEFVISHIDRIWLDVQQRHRQNQDIRGGLAAYLANQYSLGQEELGWQKVRSLLEESNSNTSDMLADLRQFLTETGYYRTLR